MLRNMLSVNICRALWNHILALFVLNSFQMVRTSICMRKDTVLEGKYLQDSVFSKLFKSSLYSCAAECYGHIICKSFNFERRTKTCFLNFANETLKGEGWMRTNPDFVYSNIRMWPESISGPCKGHVCKRDQKCIVNRNGFPVCVTSPSFGVDYKLEFVLSSKKLSWVNALKDCANQHGILAVVDTEEKYIMITKLIRDKLTRGFVWLGASDAEKEGLWKWVDGQEMKFSKWHLPEQPDNWNNEDCLGIWITDNAYNDAKCENEFLFACELIAQI